MAIDHMDQEEDTRDELGSLPPFIPPKETHVPPPEYFTGMPDRYIQHWKNEEKKGHHRRMLVRRWISIAAISVGAMIGGWFLIHQTDTTSDTPMALSSSEAYQYVMDNISDFDELMETQVQWPNEEMITEPDSSAIQQYLLEELRDNEIEEIF